MGACGICGGLGAVALALPKCQNPQGDQKCRCRLETPEPDTEGHRGTAFCGHCTDTVLHTDTPGQAKARYLIETTG